MSEETAPEEGEGKGKKGKKGKEPKEKGAKSNLLPAVVLAIGMVGAGYMLGPGSGGGGEEAHAEVEETTTTAEPVPGEIAVVEPININLADGHYVKVGMALQLAEGALAEEFNKGKSSKVNDILIFEIGGRDMEELSSPEGRAKLKEDLRQKIIDEFHEEETGDAVIDVYFTDFVMQ